MNEMKQLTPEDIKFEFCWHCKFNTAICNFCGGNACACGCHRDGKLEEQDCVKYGFWEAEKKAFELGLCPDNPTPEEIQKHVEYQKNNSYFAESDYWYINKYSKLLEVVIPSYEEIYNVEIRDCKTGKEWQKETPEYKIINPKGWKNNDFNKERIPWEVYTERRDKSECIIL